jgi:hypothetical protein
MHVLEDFEEVKCFWNDLITLDLWNKFAIVLASAFSGVAVTLLEFDKFE